jgi:hypothetical protein
MPAHHEIFALGRGIEERPRLAQRYEFIRIVAVHRQALAAEKALGGCADVLEESSKGQWVREAEKWLSQWSR